ncbi:MAG: oxygen-independent coproporphyrinogen III oxidase [Gammaproteobacteria bacterium]|nr:oxygen-independent coproporphyrinogen III oxidase [Gammaproteobacteria bacterium]
MQQSIEFNLELIRKYDRSGPRYTSYPTAVQFTDSFSAADYRAAMARGNTAGRPLSLYFHIPFCDTLCFYCACNKVATKDRSKAQPYLDLVYRELELQADLVEGERVVEQLHWGGGTPTFISHEQMRELMAKTRQHFAFADDEQGEYSIEIDPREADTATIAMLREIGFNRISMGVQDFDDQVQKAVNRIQTERETLEVLEAARAQGFRSVSLDLIYGLPHQTVESFGRTLDRVIEVGPDRLSVFNYAHLPKLFSPQRRINEADLPPPQVKLDILQATLHKLTAAGYVYIGMDHFARPEDELAVAQRERTLYRNFQGYSTHANCDLIGLGITSIGMVDNTYAQNVKTLDEYRDRIGADQLPLFRGLTLSRDDELRRDVITKLICHFELNYAEIETAWQIDFASYFSRELGELRDMEQDGLLSLDTQGIRVLPAGRFLIRNICMSFDAYLQQKPGQSFSKVI